MDHDGPSPCLNNKKRATAAEQITQLQEDYEALGKPSADKMIPVLTHNEKYPKLREQLERRKSVADVSDVDKARPHVSRSHSKRPVQSKQRGRRAKNLTRVTKKRSRNCTCSCSKCLPNILSISKSCQMSNYVTVINRRIGTDFKLVPATEAPVAVVSEINVETRKKNDVKPLKSVSGSVVGTRVSSIPSVSSFHSYYSMDHEPML